MVQAKIDALNGKVAKVGDIEPRADAPAVAQGYGVAQQRSQGREKNTT